MDSWIAVWIHDPLTRLLAQIVAIGVTSHLLGIAARWALQPRVVAEVTAGILLGPSFLGWLAPGIFRGIFPDESLASLQLISQLGLVLFMFIVGLQIDLTHLHERRSTAVWISHASIAVPFALGIALGLGLHAGMAPVGVAPLAFALFIGAAMSITAFPVLARILIERGLLRTRIGSLAIACAAVDDLTAWCVLAFVVAVARAQGLDAACWTTAAALLFVGFMWTCLRPLLGRMAARMSEGSVVRPAAVTLILLLLLLSSWTTEVIGIHALFGAFLFGAILPREGTLGPQLSARLEDLVSVILLPLFFAYSGVRTQLGLLDSAQEWLVCALVIALASLGKFGASALAARATGLPWRESSALGVLMNTRGLMELIVLNIGLDLGVIGPTLFTVMVIMALVTTFATSPALAWALPTARLQSLVPGTGRTIAAA